MTSQRIPERVVWAVELLEVRPDEHLLEVGCGPGHAVALIAEKLKRGTITAIDRSALQVAHAKQRNARWMEAGVASVGESALEDFAPGRRFDKLFAINVNAFWTAPAPSLAHLRRLLKPTGSAFLVYEPPTRRKRDELREWLPKHLAEHGFEVGDVQTVDFARGHGLCVRGAPRH